MSSTIFRKTAGNISRFSTPTENVGWDAYMKARGFREMTATESKRYDRFTECADKSGTGRSVAVRSAKFRNTK